MMNTSKKRNKKHLLGIFIMLAILYAYFNLYNNMDDIVIRILFRTDYEYRDGTFIITDSFRDASENIEKYGILYPYSEEYKVEAVAVVKDSFEGEEIELYKKILLGGFDTMEYLENHTFDEFVVMVSKLDKVLPEFISHYDRNKGYMYDEDGNEISISHRVSYWWSASEAEFWGKLWILGYPGYASMPNPEWSN